MKQNLLQLLVIALFVFISQMVYSQTGIKGTIKDSDSKETLVGATVMLDGTTYGVSTSMDGTFRIEAPAGNYKLTISYVGYEKLTMDLTIQAAQMVSLGTIELHASAIGLAGVSIMADRARERETPVAFSNINRKQISEQLGSRDIPQAMDVTPNVYSTPQGGGAGDARINVRGFNQRNVAVMINGVPMNDMENGWVYWSNWDGVGDATSSIQLQRGLSAVNLATPSIGGTMNVITNPAENKKGIIYKQEFGTGNFIKSTVFGHTGLIKGKYAFSAGGVRKTGEGVIDKTWTDAWAYYLGASWNVNSKNRLELYALGAPQRHGENRYKQNIAAYSHDYAKSEFNYPDSALSQYPEAQSGRFYNENWGPVSNQYDSTQYWNGKEHDRHNPHYINEIENYFHKPLINLNWFTQWNEKVTQYTVAYYSGGKGGGTGTKGSMKWDYSGPSRFIDFDATYANNTLSDTAKGVLRNSVNNQWTLGLISKINWKINDKFKTSFGIDGRTAEIDHFREVRDLIGGRIFIDYADEFSTDYRKSLGDKIDYHNTNTVNWLGGYAQGEYNYNKITAYGMAGYSMIKYNYINHFKKAENSEDKLTSKTDWIGGFQVKGGMSYRFTKTVNGFVNLGYVSKVPIFDAVIDDIDGTQAESPKNEKFIAIEGGAQYRSAGGKFAVTGNFYYTLWKDRTLSRYVYDSLFNENIIFIQGMGQRHYGFEIEGKYEPFKVLELIFAGSVNNWEYTNDVSGSYKDYSEENPDVTYNYYVKGLKVGDAPQTQFVAGLAVKPVKGVRAQLLGKYYANHFADWDPFSRDDINDIGQVWESPSYLIFDLHASYDFPTDGEVGVRFFVHVFNLFDEVFIQDALDNSSFNAYLGDNNEYSHQAPAAEVFLGLPKIVNFGVIVNL